MITINQGKPDSPYFAVIQTEDAGLLKIGQTVTCVHPRKQTKTLARVTGVSTCIWQEVSDSMFLYLFGFNAQQIRDAVGELQPEFKSSDRFKIFQLIELNQP